MKKFLNVYLNDWPHWRRASIMWLVMVTLFTLITMRWTSFIYFSLGYWSVDWFAYYFMEYRKKL